MKRAQKEREYGDIFQSIIQGAPLNSELLTPLKNRFQTDSTFQVFCIRIRFGVEDTTAFRQAILHLENHLTLWQKTKLLIFFLKWMTVTHWSSITCPLLTRRKLPTRF